MFEQYSVFYREKAVQTADDIVNVSDWYFEQPTPFEQGARSKFAVTCPTQPPYPFLIANHKYMVKKTFSRLAEKNATIVFYHQFWSEVIAYMVGKAFGIRTVPAFIAKLESAGTEEYVCLAEWYYNYPYTMPFTKSSGGDLLEGFIQDFDREKGRKHNLQSVKDLFNNHLPKLGIQVKDWNIEFSKLLFLDAIVGNTDRHQDNWEVIHKLTDKGFISYLSPAFDNGTSLGYEILNSELTKKKQNLDSYMRRGTHHIKMKLDDNKGIKFTDTLKVIIEELSFPEKDVCTLLEIDTSTLEKMLKGLKEFKIGQYNLIEERIDFIVELIGKRLEFFRTSL